MKTILPAGLLAAAALTLSVGVAEAHPRLISSNPAPNAHAASPGQLRLGFSETLIAKFSRIALMDGKGHMVKLGATALSPDHKQMIVPVSGRLAPGNYKVAWKAVSTDTHRVQGAYGFSVTK